VVTMKDAVSGMLRHVTLVRTDVSEEWMHVCRSVLRLLVTTNVVPSSPIVVTLMEATRSFETSVLTRGTRHNIPEDGILETYTTRNDCLTSRWP
jgi:hypothetical protein